MWRWVALCLAFVPVLLGQPKQQYSQAVLILPFQAETPAQVDLGIGIHNLFENMLLQHGGLDETWVFHSYPKLFPAYQDLERYRLGQGEPRELHTLPHRWVVTGSLKGNSLTLKATDRETGVSAGVAITIDPPIWMTARENLRSLLTKVSVPWIGVPLDLLNWKEDLSAAAMTSMGGGLRNYIEVVTYKTEGKTYDAQLLESIGKGSYLARNNLGWVHYQLGDLKQAEALFRESLAANPQGIDSLDGTQSIGIRAINLRQVEAALWGKVKARQRTEIQPSQWELIAQKLEALGDSLASEASGPYYLAALEAGDKPGGYGDKKRADLLGKIGVSAFKGGDRQKALGYFERALPLRQAANDRGGEASTLIDIGLVHSELGDKRKAIGFYEQAVPLLQTVGNVAGEAATLADIGWLLKELGEHQKSLGFFKRALPLQKTLGDKSGEATTLNNIGVAYGALSENQKAIGYLEQALPLFQAVGDRKGEATSLSSLGMVYHDSGEYRKALGYFERALPLQQAVEDQGGEATALIGMGLAHGALSENPKAIGYFERALLRLQAVQDQRDEAIALNGLGLAYSALGENQKAIGHFERALPLLQAVGDRRGEASTLNNIGGGLRSLRENSKALNYLKRALALHQAVGDQKGEATALNNIGTLHYELGEQEKALEHLDRAFQLSHAVGDRGIEAKALNNIGTVYRDLGENQKALVYYERALRLFQAVEDQSGEATAVNNMGAMYRDMREKEKSLRYLDKARLLFHAVGDPIGEATALGITGLVYSDGGDQQKALSYYNQGLLLFQAVRDRRGEAISLVNIGTAHEELGDRQKAIGYYERALPLSQAVGDRNGEKSALGNIAHAIRSDQPRLAVWYGKQAVNLQQSLRRDIAGLDRELRRSFDRTIEGTYRFLADLLIDQGRLGEAEQVLDLLKEKEAFDQLRRDKIADEFAKVDLRPHEQAALAEYNKISTDLVTIGQNLAQLQAKPERNPQEEADLSGLGQKLAAAEDVMRGYLQRLRKQFAAQSADDSQALELERAVAFQNSLRALGRDTVAIFTLVAEKRVVTMLVTPQTRKVYPYAIDRKEVHRLVAELRQKLEDSGQDPLPLLRKFHDILINTDLQSDLKKAKAKRILWSLDSTLRYIPVTALYDGKRFLGEVLEHTLMTPESRERLREAAPPQWTGVGFGASKGGSGFSPLPGVIEELAGIFRETDIGTQPLPGRSIPDEKFLREEFVRRGRNANVVHVASHFDSRPGDAENSKLLLGDGSTMTLRELSNQIGLFDGVNLLTLSACQTGIANIDTSDGREVDSLANVGLQLGAQAVLASLWKVNDRSTALFMKEFYKVRQENPGLTKTEALQRTQAAMIEGKMKGAGCGTRVNVAPKQSSFRCEEERPYAHPHYWAPFVLMGNWK